MKIKLPSHKLENLKMKKENKKPQLSNSKIIYFIKFLSKRNSVFLFSFFHSKVDELQKISYDATI